MNRRHPLLLCLLVSLFSASSPAEASPSSKEAGWPHLAGPLGTFQAIPPEGPLLDNLSLATLAWESESRDLGAGKGGGVKRNSRQDLLNSFGKERVRWAGSLTGPIVYQGVVYVASFRPAGDWVEIKGKAMRNGNELYEEPIQLQLEAEDTLTAIDAESGKTLWTFATPGGLCWTHGKRGGLQIAPAAADGSVYFVGTQGTLYAVDAGTGSERWRADLGWVSEQKRQAKEMYLKGLNPSWDKKTLRRLERLPSIQDGLYREPHTPTWHGGIRVLGDIVVCNDSATGLVAFSASTGQKLWQKSGINSYMAAPSVWRHQNKDYLLVANGASGKNPPMGKEGMLRLLDPDDGEALWAEPIGHTYPTLAPSGNRVLVNVRVTQSKDELNSGLLACYELSLKGATCLWTLPDEPRYYIPLKKDALGKVRYTLQGDRAFIRTHGKKKEASPRFLIVNARNGEILQEQSGGGKLALPNALMWYVQGNRIYASWDRHHSPNRGGRKPITLSIWSDDGIELQGDEQGPWALDLAHITGGYEVTMEHPIVDGRMYERTTAGSLVCYDLRKQPGERMISLKANNAWQGLPDALPIQLRVQEQQLRSGALWPSSGKRIGQVYTTSRTTDFWRDFPVDGLTLEGDQLKGRATLDLVGEALPTAFMALELDLTRKGEQWSGSWKRSVAAKEGYPEQTGAIQGSVDLSHRSTPTPWIAPGARHRFHPLQEGEQCISLTLMGAMPPKRDGQRQLLSLNLVLKDGVVLAGSGGAFRFSQGWHEVEASELRLEGNRLSGSIHVIAHGDNFGTSARGDEPGPLAGRIQIEATLKDAKLEGQYQAQWGIAFEAEGLISGKEVPLP